MITHAVVGVGLARLGPSGVSRGRLAVGLALLSVLPDADVVAFSLGIPYAHALGHRGLSHSLASAFGVAAVVACAGRGPLRATPGHGWALFGLCALALASHGVLDAMTDGGLGIGFFLPFDEGRYFLPWRPIQVSPIGVRRFLDGSGLAVLRSEVTCVWLPLLAAVGAVELARARRRSA